MVAPTPNERFFITGGTLDFDSPSYVERPADSKLLEYIQSGAYCYVLAARQLGKSSLMVRASFRLQKLGIRTAVIDLTKIGVQAVTADQWYLSLLTQIKRRLGLSVNPQTWWTENTALTRVQRFTQFLLEVVLAEISEQVVIFVDEIDRTVELDFTDDFFAAIRAIYNDRSMSPDLNRLSFVLLGVAAPFDLVKDAGSTPFNIGQEIVLNNLKREDAEKLQIGLRHVPQSPNQLILDRIFHWTSGHPYLTQKLCDNISKRADKFWSDEAVDGLVHQLFLSTEGRQEHNFQTIQNYINQHPRCSQLVALYRKVYTQGHVSENTSSPVHTYLKLSGLVRSDSGQLQVGNKIYRQVYNRDWIKANTPANVRRRIAISVFMVVTIVAAVLGYWGGQAKESSPAVLDSQQLAQEFENEFRSSLTSEARLAALASLLALPDKRHNLTAYRLYEALLLEEKVALFSVDLSEIPDGPSGAAMIVKETYFKLPNTPETIHLLEAMVNALDQTNDIESRLLAREIAAWVAGRRAFTQKDFQNAKSHYDGAIALNRTNASVFYERATVLAELGDYDAALIDFQQALELDETLERRIEQHLAENDRLNAVWWDRVANYPRLVDILPTPTGTAAPLIVTPTPDDNPIRRTATPTPTERPTLTATPTPPNPRATIGVATRFPVPAANTPVAKVIYVKGGGMTHDLHWAVSSANPVRDALFVVRAAAPAWSPDGTRIAFFGEPGIDNEDPTFKLGEGVWVVDQTGTPPKQLVKTDHIKNLTWSPDGLKLAFEIQLPDRNAEVVVIDTADGTPISRFSGQQPGWGPHSEQLAVKACLPTCGIWQVKMDGSTVRPLTYLSSDSYPSWSPTGQHLAYASERAGNWDIFLLHLSNNTEQRLTFQQDIDTTPVFSPDGGEIYYRRKRDDRVWEIIVMQLSGLGKRSVAQNVGPSDEWGMARPAVHR